MKRDRDHHREVLSDFMAQYDEALATDSSTLGMDESRLHDDPKLIGQWSATKRCLEILDRARRRGIPQALVDSVPSTAASSPAPVSGKSSRVARFEIERELGRGGLGVVFLAHDPKLRRDVALKVPRLEAGLDPDLRRRFLREAEAAARLSHPNLIALYEVGEDGPICYLASEYCAGPTLAQWLQQRTEAVPVRQAASLVLQLAEAVEHAHSRGVLHRDIKPGNVMLETALALGHEGRGEPLEISPKLTDFGMAKLLEQASGDTARAL